jgi:hypothetical protein
MALAAIGWTLGLSYRGLVALFGPLGVKIERMSAWRDVQAHAHLWKKKGTGNQCGIRRGWSLRSGVGEDTAGIGGRRFGQGQPVTVGYVDEKDPQAVKRFLEPLMQRLGVSVIVTDDLSSYKVGRPRIEPGTPGLPVHTSGAGLDECSENCERTYPLKDRRYWMK